MKICYTFFFTYTAIKIKLYTKNHEIKLKNKILIIRISKLNSFFEEENMGKILFEKKKHNVLKSLLFFRIQKNMFYLKTKIIS
jgi:hypothetical protein